ncbi:hypothetical protein [Enterococcus olivae]
MEASTGFFVWNEAQQNYVQTNPTVTATSVDQTLQLSKINEEAIPILLQAIWCRRKGAVNINIGISKEQDAQIAQQLNVW